MNLVKVKKGIWNEYSMETMNLIHKSPHGPVERECLSKLNYWLPVCTWASCLTSLFLTPHLENPLRAVRI